MLLFQQLFINKINLNSLHVFESATMAEPISQLWISSKSRSWDGVRFEYKCRFYSASFRTHDESILYGWHFSNTNLKLCYWLNPKKARKQKFKISGQSPLLQSWFKSSFWKASMLFFTITLFWQNLSLVSKKDIQCQKVLRYQ